MRAVVFCTMVLVLAPVHGWDFSIGASAGVTVASMIGDDFEDIKIEEADFWSTSLGATATVETRWGAALSAAVFATMGLNRLIAIQPELWYAQTRSGMETTVAGYTGGLNYRWVYRTLELTVPVKMRFRLRGLGDFGRGSTEMSLYAGPTVAYLLDPPPELEISPDGGDSETIDWGTEMDFQCYAFGAVGGADVRRTYPSGFFLGLDARFAWNLTSFDNFPGPYANDTRMPYVRLAVQAGARF